MNAQPEDLSHLNREGIEAKRQAAALAALSVSELVALFTVEEAVAERAPDGYYRRDPRDGAVILFNEVRARRPHDNRPAETAVAAATPCPICQGKTTGIVDVASLSKGATFINKNLYPALFPAVPEGGVAGLHFLQWTSSYHKHDWHNLPQKDRVTVLQRLAALEQKLLAAAEPALPRVEAWPDGAPYRGYLGIFKNFGHLVGGSLAHGHQQMVYSPLLPPVLARNWRFAQAQDEPFAAHLLRENPSHLLLRDYGPLLLLVPYFMKRPYHMMLIPKDTGKRLLHDLDDAEMAAMAEGWHDAIRLIRWAMPAIGREIAYNVVVHNGPGGGLYVEFLPYAQEIGGMEHLGLWICHGTPETAVAELRRWLPRRRITR